MTEREVAIFTTFADTAISPRPPLPPVVPPSPTFVALAWPSISRLNLPPSVAGTSFLVTLIVPVSRVFVT